MAKTGETVAVNVKVRRALRGGARRLFAAPGVVDAVQTFPDESDDELRRLYVLKVDRSKLLAVLRRLRDDPTVEFAEEAASRHLIR